MRTKILTTSFSQALGRFDDDSLVAFTKDRDVLSIREHFFEIGGAEVE